MTKTSTLRCVLLVSALVSAGCATIFNGRHQNVLVVSEPSGAAIRLNGREAGSTPATVRMRRRGPAVLDLQMAGFAPATIPVTNSTSRAVFANVIFLNPMAAQGMDSMSQWAASAAAWFIGSLSLDIWSGGAFRRPPVVTVTLTPLAPPSVALTALPPPALRRPPDY